MSSTPNDNPARLGEYVDAVADQFEAAWKGVQPPHVAEFLADATEEQRAALLPELREIDREYRTRLTERAAAHETLSAISTPSPEDGQSKICNLQSKICNSPPGYEILRELGRGGMSVVYLARQTGLKRLVALKMLHAGADAGSRQRQRLRTEAESAARLQHPNIVQIHEVGEHDGQLYLALEYVEGGTLADRLAGAPHPARAAAELVETLARAMHHAHQQGIVHRDLKPANILLVSGGVVSGGVVSGRVVSGGVVSGVVEANEAGTAATTHHSPLTTHQPKISDFGLAKQLADDSSQTRTGEIVGTPSYMAPEQAEGKHREIGPPADIYALGAILYELLTGRPPHRGETTLDTLEQVRSQEPLPPSRLQPKLPRDLETICLKALAKTPARRCGDRWHP